MKNLIMIFALGIVFCGHCSESFAQSQQSISAEIQLTLDTLSHFAKDLQDRVDKEKDVHGRFHSC